MKHQTILITTMAWAEKIGPRKAKSELILAGFSSRFADQLIDGSYQHRFRQSSINKLKKIGVINA